MDDRPDPGRVAIQAAVSDAAAHIEHAALLRAELTDTQWQLKQEKARADAAEQRVAELAAQIRLLEHGTPPPPPDPAATA